MAVIFLIVNMNGLFLEFNTRQMLKELDRQRNKTKIVE